MFWQSRKYNFVLSKKIIKINKYKVWFVEKIKKILQKLWKIVKIFENIEKILHK